jgi:hypothetical protein
MMINIASPRGREAAPRVSIVGGIGRERYFEWRRLPMIGLVGEQVEVGGSGSYYNTS